MGQNAHTRRAEYIRMASKGGLAAIGVKCAVAAHGVSTVVRRCSCLLVSPLSYHAHLTLFPLVCVLHSCFRLQSVDSAGTSGEHDGEAPDDRSIAVARRHGIDISKHQSRRITAQDWNKFNYILALDSSGSRGRNFRTEHERGPRRLLTDSHATATRLCCSLSAAWIPPTTATHFAPSRRMVSPQRCDEHAR